MQVDSLSILVSFGHHSSYLLVVALQELVVGQVNSVLIYVYFRFSYDIYLEFTE